MDGRRIFRLGFDLSMVVVEAFFFKAIVERGNDLNFKLLLPAYLLYCLALFLKSRDEAYLRGFSWFSRKRMFWVAAFLFLQTTLGALAFGSLQVILDERKPSGLLVVLDVAALLFLFCLALVLTVRLLLIARRRFPDPSAAPTSGGGRPVSLAVSDLGLWAMGLTLLAFFYSLAPRGTPAWSGSLTGFLAAFLLTCALGLLFYFPARFHYILEDHADVWNWIGFFSSMAVFALFLVRGIS